MPCLTLRPLATGRGPVRSTGTVSLFGSWVHGCLPWCRAHPGPAVECGLHPAGSRPAHQAGPVAALQLALVPQVGARLAQRRPLACALGLLSCKALAPCWSCPAAPGDPPPSLLLLAAADGAAVQQVAWLGFLSLARTAVASCLRCVHWLVDGAALAFCSSPADAPSMPLTCQQRHCSRVSWTCVAQQT